MIIAHALLPETLHKLQKSDMFTLWLERQHDTMPRVSSAAANQKGH